MDCWSYAQGPASLSLLYMYNMWGDVYTYKYCMHKERQPLEQSTDIILTLAAILSSSSFCALSVLLYGQFVSIATDRIIHTRAPLFFFFSFHRTEPQQIKEIERRPFSLERGASKRKAAHKHLIKVDPVFGLYIYFPFWWKSRLQYYSSTFVPPYSTKSRFHIWTNQNLWLLFFWESK